MKLIFAIVQNEDSRKLMRELVKNDLSVTRIASTGGFLHSGNATLMIGVTDDRLNKALEYNQAEFGHMQESDNNAVGIPQRGFFRL